MFLQVTLTLLHVVVGLILIGVVLLQTGKRADLAGAFGGGGSQTAFGTRGAATLLSKVTTAAAVLFMITSIGLSIMANNQAGSSGTVLDRVEGEAAATQPAPDGDATTPQGLPALPELDPATDDGSSDDASTDDDTQN